MAVAATELSPLILHFSPTLQRMSDDEFYQFCRLNPDWRIERTSRGDLIIMPPTGGETGRRNFTLTAAFGAWADADGSGIGFDSSTGFTLPSGAKRSPDLAWVRRSRWDQLTADQRERFPPMCPDFVVELRSLSDSLDLVQAKMDEYMAAGAQLGWLVDPTERRVYIYRPGFPVDCREDPAEIRGDPILPGFALDLGRIWR